MVNISLPVLQPEIVYFKEERRKVKLSCPFCRSTIVNYSFTSSIGTLLNSLHLRVYPVTSHVYNVYKVKLYYRGQFTISNTHKMCSTGTTMKQKLKGACIIRLKKRSFLEIESKSQISAYKFQFELVFHKLLGLSLS